MSDIAIVPEASSRDLLNSLSRHQQAPIVAEVRTVLDHELQDILKEDIDHLFADHPRSLDEIIGSGEKTFARYRGNRAVLLTELERRPRIDFLALCYVGKIPNHIQTGDVRFDLAELCFFKRLDFFCRQLSDVLGKPVSFTIAVEDQFFDTHIFGYETSYSSETLQRSREELERLGCTNVNAEPLTRYLSTEFLSVFETRVLESARDLGNISEAMRRTFELAYPTTAFEAALRQYDDLRGREVIQHWADYRVRQYMAFFEARDRTRFWECNRLFMRATDSERESVVQVEFGVGRVSVPHGVAILRNAHVIDCEYYYDFITERAKTGEAICELVDERGQHLAFC